MYSSRCVLLSVTPLLFILPLFVRSQASNETVNAEDSSIDYDGSGWTSSAGHMFTHESGSFSFDFTGSAIYWYSRKLYDGATATVSVDGNSVTIDTSSGMSQDSTPVVSVLFSRSGLDASQGHTLTVAWVGTGGNGVGTYLENWQLVFTEGSSSSSTGTTTTTTASSPTSTSTSSSTPPAATATSTTSTSTSQSSSGSTTIESVSTRVSTSSRLITSVLSGSTFVSTSNSIFTFTVSASSAETPDAASTHGSSSFGASTSGTSTESAAATAQLNSSPNLAAIIGGTVGGVLAILVLVIAIFYIRWRRKYLAAQQSSQSATPFYTPRDPINGPSGDPFRPNSKHPLTSESQSPLQQLSGTERLYVLVDPVTMRPVSNAAALPSLSLEGSSSGMSSPSFTRRWKWARSTTVQDSVPRPPQDGNPSPSSLAAVVGAYEMSDRPRPVALLPVPMSPGVVRQPSTIDDPPPEYRR